MDWTARLWREGKARLSANVTGGMTRIGTSAECWEARMKKLLGKPRLFGSYFSTSDTRLKEITSRRSVHHVDNAVGRLSMGLRTVWQALR
ncbi:MAG: hypothetical protein KF851_00180 [Pirellulaceae bacterium]|nr:hypothetical protein [Pirellulaceae bacterium]